MRSMRADLQRWEPRQVLSYMPLRPSGGSWDGDRAVAPGLDVAQEEGGVTATAQGDGTAQARCLLWHQRIAARDFLLAPDEVDKAVGVPRPGRGGAAAHRAVGAVLRRDLVVRHDYPFVTRSANAIRVTVVTESTLKPSTSPCSSPVVQVLSVRSWFFCALESVGFSVPAIVSATVGGKLP